MRTLGFPQGHPRSAVARKGRGQQADRVRASPRYSCTGVRCAGGAPASAMRTTRRQSRVAGSYALSAIWGAPPPHAAMICKKASFRGVLRYIVRPRFGWIRSIKIIQLYTPMPKRRQIKGSEWPKYSRRRENDTPYSPLPGRFGGGYTSSRI